jgi:Rrf2 family transcriptional regulator, iron-sulfur cluster assembly transcription factor
MQLSKGFDYAVRSLVFLALSPEGKPAELKAISETQGVPVSYLAKVMRSLVRSGIVASTLGRDGGYTLRRRPESITLLEVYVAIEGRMRLVECLEGDGGCMFIQDCTQASVWRRLESTVEGFLTETTLRDLLPAPSSGGGLGSAKERKYAGAGA